MRDHLKYCLRLRLEIRALKKEAEGLEATNGDPLTQVQAIAKARHLRDEISDLNKLAELVHQKYEFVWW